MASGAFNHGINKINDQTLNLVTATVKVALMKSSYVFNPDSDFLSSITADELSVVGYSRQTLGSKVFAEDDTNNRATFDSADVTFTALASGQTVGGAIIYVDTGSDASSSLIGWAELATPRNTNNGDFVIEWPSAGIITWTTA